MALRPVDNETFYREVDEELRRDQLKTYWERFGKLVIAGVVLLLAAIGGYIWWQNQKEVKAGERSATLVEALEEVASGRKKAATRVSLRSPAFTSFWFCHQMKPPIRASTSTTPAMTSLPNRSQ